MPIRVKPTLARTLPFGARGHLFASAFAALLGGCALAVVLAVHFGASAFVPAYVIFGLSGGIIGIYDIRRHKVPNWMLIPTSSVVALLLVIGSAIDGRWSSMVRGCCAAAALTLAFGALAIAFRRGLGFGDVKLAGLVGLVVGYVSWHAVLLAMVLTFVTAAIVGLALLIRLAGPRSDIPLAPFLIVGAVVAICVSN
jgi:leader peptidase (prepilin peptidase)/N-methyltransferase